MSTCSKHAGTAARPATYSAAAALRHTLLWASGRDLIKRTITVAPVTRTLVKRFVAGETVADAVRVTRELVSTGLLVSLDHLGEDTRDGAGAAHAVATYRDLIAQLGAQQLAASAEVSVKLSAVGQALDEKLALDNARAICAAAHAAGTTVTIDMEDHTTTDATLRAVTELRADYPSTGAVIQASLRRSEQDCRDLASPGSRVRLCKGAYQEPPHVAWQQRDEVNSAFLRCLRILLSGDAYAMVATHDPKLIGASTRMFRELAPQSDHEYQMLYGIRPDEQMRLGESGEKVRVYTPFGDQWYPYLMRRMAERPANLALVLRALVSRS
jgi:proline dehydrogenase